MYAKEPPGVILSAVLALLAAASIFCGVDAILADSVTTPARFGGDTRVYGMNTCFVGAGWILMGAAIATSLITSHLRIRSGRLIAVGLCVLVGVCWLIPIF